MAVRLRLIALDSWLKSTWIARAATSFVSHIQSINNSYKSNGVAYAIRVKMTRCRAIFIYLFFSLFFFFFWFIDDIVLFFIIIIYRVYRGYSVPSSFFYSEFFFFPFFFLLFFKKRAFYVYHFSWRQSEILFLWVPESHSMLYTDQFLFYKLSLKRVYNLYNSF